MQALCIGLERMNTMGTLASIQFDFEKIQWEDWLFKVGLIFLKLFIFYLIYKIVRAFTFKIVESIFQRIQMKESVSDNRIKTLESLTKNIIGYIFIFILTVTILQMFNIEVGPVLAGAGVVGLAVGFGAQGLVSDVVTGFFILLERQIDVGDEVTIGAIKGTVEIVGLKTIQIRDYDGSLHFIPNRQVGILSNHSRGIMRALVEIKITKDDNLELITDAIKDICKNMANEDDDIVMGPEMLGIQDLGASELSLRIVARTTNGQQFQVERELRMKIKEAIDIIRKLEAEKAEAD